MGAGNSEGYWFVPIVMAISVHKWLPRNPW